MQLPFCVAGSNVADAHLFRGILKFLPAHVNVTATSFSLSACFHFFLAAVALCILCPSVFWDTITEERISPGRFKICC